MYTSRSSQVSYSRDRQVHRHRLQEAGEAVGILSERAHGVDDGLEDGVVGAAGGEVGEEAVTEICECLGAHVAGDVVEVVDDVVGVPAERIQRPYVVPLDARQRPGRPVVRGAVALVELRGSARTTPPA